MTASDRGSSPVPPSLSRYQATPRSMRDTAASPQTWAMSVALVDQGEMVPGRGTTSWSCPGGGNGAAAGP